MARSRASDNPMPPEGSWIKFRLDLKNFKYEEVAKKARRSVTLVSQVISGKRRSNNVQAALADILGFASYEELMYYARRESKGGAA